MALASGLVAAGLPQLVGAAVPIESTDIIAGTGGFTVETNIVARNLGQVLAGGADVNGDGLSDFVIGHAYGITGHGAVSLSTPNVNECVFGKPDTARVDLSRVQAGTGGFAVGRPEVLLPANQAHYLPTFLGPSVGMLGDVNGDGYGDFVTIGPRHSGSSMASHRFVVFGGPSLGPPVHVLSQIAAGTGGFVIDQLPSSGNPSVNGQNISAAGDFNGDGLADIAIGEPSSNIPPLLGGLVYVVFGRTETTPVFQSNIAAGTGGLVIHYVSRSGARVAPVGDVNGDGLGDLAIKLENSVAVIYGRTSTAPLSLVSLGGTSSIGFMIGFESSYAIGNPAAGDVNGDGLDDIVLPATTAQRAAVVFGRTGTRPSVAMSDVVAGTGGFAVGEQVLVYNAYPLLASATGVGDLNGDGLADVVFGAPQVFQPRPPGQVFGFQGSGNAYILFGRTATTPVAQSDLDANAGGLFIHGGPESGLFGRSPQPGGDLDGDGRADFLIGAPASEPLATTPARSYYGTNATGRVFAFFNPFDQPVSSTYHITAAAGNPGARGPGGRGLGADRTTYVDSRVWVDFADGSGPGTAGSSRITATLTRNDAGIAAMTPAHLADVQWTVSSNRTNAVAPRVSLRYTNAEIAGLDEGALQLLVAPTAAGPFVPVANMNIDAARNMASGDVTLPAVLVLADPSPPRATITRLGPSTTTEQNPAWLVSFNRPVVGVFDLDDIEVAGSLADRVLHTSVAGAGTEYIVRMFTEDTGDAGSLGFEVLAAAMSDTLGLPSLAASAPIYTINEVGAGIMPGDMNKDSMVNVADVTALADHIVNGTPLP